MQPEQEGHEIDIDNKPGDLSSAPGSSSSELKPDMSPRTVSRDVEGSTAATPEALSHRLEQLTSLVAAASDSERTDRLL